MLTLKTKQLALRIDADAILYVEVSGHDLIFHTAEKEHCIWGTLSKIEHELEGGSFSRCNACYLVNLKYVEHVKGLTVSVRGRELSISRNRRREFMEELARYKGGCF
jgi:DNA-binding LytR/AlgR family response regulator